ncbi:hypothetical protein T265_08180 [Opisthorchis viverrini]|uniref:Uncharacterized protein n=1 Tax=Opisthorchis viverrini TaxID=6198 RepID=A0A074ZA09_OPIVI|nr:hypothetical protein T265_08180 [Opisthorchis viverrini]KER24091.1 hypothetical protein T265_08180 [Opisthorchis viverrini]
MDQELSPNREGFRLISSQLKLLKEATHLWDVCTAEVSNPHLRFRISGPVADVIKRQLTVVTMSQWSSN